MNKYYYLTFLLSFFITANSFACRNSRLTLAELNSHHALMQLSDNKKFLLKMIPSKWKKGKDKYKFTKIREAYAIAFKISESGQLKYMWSAKGIYPKERRKSFRILYSNDGKTVVKVDPYPGITLTEKGRAHPSQKSVIEIYRDGRIIRSYSLTSFLSERTMKAGRNSCGSVGWLDERYIDSYEDVVRLKTIEGKKLKINIKNGGIARD